MQIRSFRGVFYNTFVERTHTQHLKKLYHILSQKSLGNIYFFICVGKLLGERHEAGRRAQVRWKGRGRGPARQIWYNQTPGPGQRGGGQGMNVLMRGVNSEVPVFLPI